MQNTIYGFLFAFVGLLFIAGSFWADNSIGTFLGLFVAGSIAATGVWLIKSKVVYWSPMEGFTPKYKKGE